MVDFKKEFIDDSFDNSKNNDTNENKQIFQDIRSLGSEYGLYKDGLNSLRNEITSCTSKQLKELRRLTPASTLWKYAWNTVAFLSDFTEGKINIESLELEWLSAIVQNWDKEIDSQISKYENSTPDERDILKEEFEDVFLLSIEQAIIAINQLKTKLNEKTDQVCTGAITPDIPENLTDSTSAEFWIDSEYYPNMDVDQLKASINEKITHLDGVFSDNYEEEVAFIKELIEERKSEGQSPDQYQDLILSLEFLNQLNGDLETYLEYLEEEMNKDTDFIEVWDPKKVIRFEEPDHYQKKLAYINYLLKDHLSTASFIFKEHPLWAIGGTLVIIGMLIFGRNLIMGGARILFSKLPIPVFITNAYEAITESNEINNINKAKKRNKLDIEKDKVKVENIHRQVHFYLEVINNLDEDSPKIQELSKVINSAKSWKIPNWYIFEKKILKLTWMGNIKEINKAIEPYELVYLNNTYRFWSIKAKGDIENALLLVDEVEKCERALPDKKSPDYKTAAANRETAIENLKKHSIDWIEINKKIPISAGNWEKLRLNIFEAFKRAL